MVEKYMNMAIEEAKKAYNCGEVPIGAIIVKNNEVIACAHNTKERCNSVVGHAEINAILIASAKLKNWRLYGCDIYVTLEPCPMCASAIKQSRISNVYCGLSNLDVNNNAIIKQIFNSDRINPAVTLHDNFKYAEIEKLLKDFFSKRR